MIFNNLSIAALLFGTVFGQNILTPNDLANSSFKRKGKTNDYYFPAGQYTGPHCHLVTTLAPSPPNPVGSRILQNLSCGMGNNLGTYVQMVNGGVATGNPLLAANVAAFGGDWDTARRNTKQAAKLMASVGMNVAPYAGLRRLDEDATSEVALGVTLKEHHTLSRADLTAELFKKSTGSGWYFPSTSARPHIHVDIDVDDQGNRYVSYIGLTNGGSAGAITDLVKDGKQTMNSISQTNWDAYETKYLAALDVMDRCVPAYNTAPYRTGGRRLAIADRLNQLLVN